VIETLERASEAGAGGEVFTVSEMTAEVHEFPSGTLIGFNGTTEWALDSVSIDETLWLPREDQLRELLGSAFGGLGAGYVVMVRIDGSERTFESPDAADAYARALLALLDSLR
jgi:hypothetical protein